MYFLKKYRRGIKNRYRKAMPLSEIISKDLVNSWREVVYFFRNNFKRKAILVYPHYPSSGSTIYRIGKVLNYNITNNPKKHFDVAVYWEYLTFRQEYDMLENLSGKTKVVNLYSRDISKVFVDSVFKKVFSYSTIIDPLVYNGKFVKKSDINARHDGEILTGPAIQKEEGYIYQVLIDNSYGEGLVKDIRVPVVDGLMDFVYLKYRPVSERFKNTTVRTELAKTSEIFSPEEVDLLNRFCREIHLNYGELDVLRDNADQRIYVVDVNNTPQGPPKNTSAQDKSRALKEIASRFKRIYLEA